MIAEGRNLLPINPLISLVPAAALATMVIGGTSRDGLARSVVGREQRR